MTMEQIREFAANIPATLEGIATHRIPSSDIPEFCKKLVVYNNAFFTEAHSATGKQGGHKRDVPYESLVDKTLLVAHELTYAVALSETLLGQMHELGLTPSRKEDIIMGHVIRAAGVLRDEPELFGDNTPQIYEGIVERLSVSRPKTTTHRLAGEEFPHFTSANA